MREVLAAQDTVAPSMTRGSYTRMWTPGEDSFNDEMYEYTVFKLKAERMSLNEDSFRQAYIRAQFAISTEMRALNAAADPPCFESNM